MTGVTWQFFLPEGMELWVGMFCGSKRRVHSHTRSLSLWVNAAVTAKLKSSNTISEIKSPANNLAGNAPASPPKLAADTQTENKHSQLCPSSTLFYNGWPWFFSFLVTSKWRRIRQASSIGRASLLLSSTAEVSLDEFYLDFLWIKSNTLWIQFHVGVIHCINSKNINKLL